jgi:hypothetical protein
MLTCAHTHPKMIIYTRMHAYAHTCTHTRICTHSFSHKRTTTTVTHLNAMGTDLAVLKHQLHQGLARAQHAPAESLARRHRHHVGVEKQHTLEHTLLTSGSCKRTACSCRGIEDTHTHTPVVKRSNNHTNTHFNSTPFLEALTQG